MAKDIAVGGCRRRQFAFGGLRLQTANVRDRALVVCAQCWSLACPALIAALVFFGSDRVFGTESVATKNISSNGVRHILTASLTIDPASPLAGRKLEADLRVTIRISDHSPQADFYGLINERFTDIGSTQSARAIWQATKCHHDRGLPKVSVMAIGGTISDGAAKIEISATPRHIGKLVPSDEIMIFKEARSVPNSSAKAVLVTRAKTVSSHLLLELHLTALACAL